MRILLDQVGRRALGIAAGARCGDPHGVVVILGATGTGKTNLSLELATRFRGEVVNSDKMQVYRGLDVTTNKVSVLERRGVPHHLLGELDPHAGELSPASFRSLASRRIESIQARRRLPIVAGGSNSFVHALLASTHKTNSDPFASPMPEGLRYRCCILWVDVGWEVLVRYLDKRVDEMLGMGMVKELEENYRPARTGDGVYRGLEMAIGVPEFDRFFARYPPARGGGWRAGEREAYEEAVEEIKENTRELARRQLEKIGRLRSDMGWPMRRLDATEAVSRKLEGREVETAWTAAVVGPAVEEVATFLAEEADAAVEVA